MRILGLDPGLKHTGWGVVDNISNRLSYVASGVITSDDKLDLAQRIAVLHNGIIGVIKVHSPDEAAIEETFVNKNPLTTLRLGQARGAVLLAPALMELPVYEYSPNLIKKTVVGTGHAEKQQIQAMIKILLPKASEKNADANDALAVAICHAYNALNRKLKGLIK